LPSIFYNNFVRCSLLNLPFRNKVFDFAQCSHVIEHLERHDILSGLKQLRYVSSTSKIIYPKWFMNGHRDHRSLIIFERVLPQSGLLKFMSRKLEFILTKLRLLQWFSRFTENITIV